MQSKHMRTALAVGAAVFVAACSNPSSNATSPNTSKTIVQASEDVASVSANEVSHPNVKSPRRNAVGGASGAARSRKAHAPSPKSAPAGARFHCSTAKAAGVRPANLISYMRRYAASILRA